MSTEPTRVHFDPSALSERQLDGLACVVCGDVFAAGSRSVPAGEALGAQVFACSSCVDDPRDVDPAVSAAALDQLAAKYGLTDEVAEVRAYGAERDEQLRERAARRSTWPGGEPDEVRAAAERHAAIDDLSRVIDELESALASRDPRRLDQAVTQAGPVVQRARTLIAEWDARRAE